MLLTALTPISSSAEKTEDTEPPSATPTVTVLLAVESPTLTPVVAGKSLADEQAEREAAEKAAKEAQAAKLQAEKEAERIKHLAAQKQLNTARSEQKQAEYVKIIGNSYEQCVVYARRVSKNTKISGYAGDLVAEGQEPKVGALALERNYGHVSIVVAIDGDYLILHDANWVTGHITERKVHKSTQRGYIY